MVYARIPTPVLTNETFVVVVPNVSDRPIHVGSIWAGKIAHPVEARLAPGAIPIQIGPE